MRIHQHINENSLHIINELSEMLYPYRSNSIWVHRYIKSTRTTKSLWIGVNQILKRNYLLQYDWFYRLFLLSIKIQYLKGHIPAY